MEISDKSTSLSYLLFPMHSSNNELEDLRVIIDSSSLKLLANFEQILKLELKSLPHTVDWSGSLLEFSNKRSKQRSQFFYGGSTLYIQLLENNFSNIIFNEKSLNSLGYLLKKCTQNQYIIFLDAFMPVNNEVELISLFQNEIEGLKKQIGEIPENSGFILSSLWINTWIPPLFNAYQFDYLISSPKNEFQVSGDCFNSSHTSFDKLDPYNQILIMDDLLWYIPAKIKTLLPHFQDNLAQMIRNSLEYQSKSNKSPEMQRCPPLYSHFLLTYFKYCGDRTLLKEIYNLLLQDLQWWENNRFDPQFGLFYSKGSIFELESETRDFNSPRFRLKYHNNEFTLIGGNESRNMILVDINAQMCDYYQNMGIFTMMLNIPSFNDFFKKAEFLQRSYELLWDEETHFYYDYDMDQNSLQYFKTNAGFWAMFGGTAAKSHISPLVRHLTDSKEFWSNTPIPHIPSDEISKLLSVPHNFFNLGTIAHNYWTIIGLRRYNYNEHATQIALKTFNFLTEIFTKNGWIPSFFPISNHNSRTLTKQDRINTSSYSLNLKKGVSKRKNIRDSSEEYSNFMYHSPFPLHSLFYKGILGAEILDRSLNFIPCWKIIDEEIKFRFNYGGTWRMGVLSEKKQKMFETFIDHQI